MVSPSGSLVQILEKDEKEAILLREISFWKSHVDARTLDGFICLFFMRMVRVQYLCSGGTGMKAPLSSSDL